MSRILIVEDEFSISNFMKTVLEGDGYTVEVATCAAQARAALDRAEYQVLLLDLGLPDADGLELLRELRQRYALPVIVVSARTEESEKVAALDCGADDYITKPFGSPELLARIRAALRRAGPAAGTTAFTTGALTIDYDKHLVTIEGKPVHLTANEYRLVELLSRSAGKVLTYDRISEAMWGDAAGGIPPHRLADAVVGEDLAGAAAQKLHQAVFVGGQMHRLALDGHQVLIIIDGERPGGKGGGAGSGTGPAQRRPDACQQLRRAERLGDIVIGAAVQGGHLFAFLGAGRNHNDRQGVPLPQLPQKLQPVGVRQSEIQQQHLVFRPVQRRTGLCRTGGHLHGVAVALQHRLHKITDGKLVLHDQNSTHRFRPPLWSVSAG